jgi:hypothetical protein
VSNAPLDPARIRARRTLIALAAAVAVALTMVAVVVARLLAAGQGDDGPPDGQHAAPTSVVPRRTPAGTRQVGWVDVAGVQVPVSAVHGPHVLDGGRAAGYTHDAPGAALAAVQVLTRTSPTTGPAVYRPVLAEQVIGVNTEALAVNLDHASPRGLSREAAPRNDATVAGYQVTTYHQDGTTAVIDVLLSSPRIPAGQAVDFTIEVRWLDADWRVLAPPKGDWGAVATVVTVPDDTLDYAQVG